MLTFKGHFDGNAIVLDEPASLEVGQAVQVVVDFIPASGEHPAGRHHLADSFIDGFTPFAAMTATFMNCDEWDESAALHVDPLDAIPADFGRIPGSAAGQIQMADDFDDTPDEFEDYL